MVHPQHDGDVEILAESLIGAGTLIPDDKVIPPHSVVIGSPCKVIRQVTEDDRKMFHEDFER